MMVNAVVLTAVISPIVCFFYKPSKTYVHKSRTIQNAKRDAELPIMVCIYNQDNVPRSLNILEASNPTRASPIATYVLHLVELVGRSTPLLITHKLNEKLSDKASPSDHIINRFRIYERQNQGIVYIQPFTAITPLVTAHEDICTLAADKRASLIIIPFHKQWNIDGTTQSSKWRNTNKKVLDKAPCSVGILIDRGGLKGTTSVSSCLSSYKVGVIFLGGPDDREVIYYAMRMAEHPKVHLTVHRIVPINNAISNVMEKRIDSDVVNGYRVDTANSQNRFYIEDLVKDGVEIVSLIRTIQESYNLILVGRSHANYSQLLSAFTEWSEYPELGFFGDMFATSDDLNVNVSVLVIQQHFHTSIDAMPGSPGRS